MRIFIAGLTSKKLLASVFLLFLVATVFGVDIVNGEAPRFKGGNYPTGVLEEINNQMASDFNKFIDSLNDNLAFLPKIVPNFTKGLANASVFSSDGASQRGYEGYKAFSITFGSVIAFQIPELSIINKVTDVINNSEDDIVDSIKNIFNIPFTFGFDAKALNAQLGINTSFLLKGLYLGFNFGMFDTDWIEIIPSDFSFKTMSIGVNASYQLIGQKSLLGLFVWRGLNLGAGFTWQKTSFAFTPSLSINDLEPFPLIPMPSGGDINLPLDGSLHLGFDTNTYIIPLKAVTSLRLLGFLNVALGAGCDIAFGGSSIDARGSFYVSDSDDIKQSLPEGVEMDLPSLTINLPVETSSPGLFNPKVMGAVGFNFGPIIIDIPLTYYFKDNGYSLGFTLGFSL
jgi:hypothetical protein